MQCAVPAKSQPDRLWICWESGSKSEQSSQWFERCNFKFVAGWTSNSYRFGPWWANRILGVWTRLKSSRGATAILAAATTFETCLERPFRRTIANKLYNHCEILRPMSYCTNHCDRKQLLRRHPLRNPSLLWTPENSPRSWDPCRTAPCRVSQTIAWICPSTPTKGPIAIQELCKEGGIACLGRRGRYERGLLAGGTLESLKTLDSVNL